MHTGSDGAKVEKPGMAILYSIILTKTQRERKKESERKGEKKRELENENFARFF
jgi:hypothetical protein